MAAPFTSWAQRQAAQNAIARVQQAQAFITRRKTALGSNYDKPRRAAMRAADSARVQNLSSYSKHLNTGGLGNSQAYSMFQRARDSGEFKGKSFGEWARAYNASIKSSPSPTAPSSSSSSGHTVQVKDYVPGTLPRWGFDHKANPSAAAGRLGHILADGRYLVRGSDFVRNPSSVYVPGTLPRGGFDHGADPSAGPGQVGHILKDGRYLVPGSFTQRNLYSGPGADRPMLQYARATAPNVEPERHSPYYVNPTPLSPNVEPSRHSPAYITQRQPSANIEPQYHSPYYVNPETPDDALAQPTSIHTGGNHWWVPDPVERFFGSGMWSSGAPPGANLLTVLWLLGIAVAFLRAWVWVVSNTLWVFTHGS